MIITIFCDKSYVNVELMYNIYVTFITEYCYNHSILLLLKLSWNSLLYKCNDFSILTEHLWTVAITFAVWNVTAKLDFIFLPQNFMQEKIQSYILANTAYDLFPHVENFHFFTSRKHFMASLWHIRITRITTLVFWGVYPVK